MSEGVDSKTKGSEGGGMRFWLAKKLCKFFGHQPEPKEYITDSLRAYECIRCDDREERWVPDRRLTEVTNKFVQECTEYVSDRLLPKEGK